MLPYWACVKGELPYSMSRGRTGANLHAVQHSKKGHCCFNTKTLAHKLQDHVNCTLIYYKYHHSCFGVVLWPHDKEKYGQGYYMQLSQQRSLLEEQFYFCSELNVISITSFSTQTQLLCQENTLFRATCITSHLSP